MNLALLLPDGVGVRNFLFGRFLGQAAETGQICVLHTIEQQLLASCRPAFDGLDRNVRWVSLKTYRETAVCAILRYCLAYAHMYWADTHAMRQIRDLPVRGSWRTQVVNRAARFLGWAAASPRGIKLLGQWHCWMISLTAEVNYYRRLLEDVRPSVLFCSHQRPPWVVPPVLAARLLGIPTATFIFSWDNLTSKGRIAAPFDHYLVWSDHMRQELLQYYPDVAPDRVHIVGTPQFDPYADANLIWSREEFFRRIGADAGRPLLCYSGGDVDVCPEDPQHVGIVMELIRSGRIHGNPQVLLRPAPVDEGSRYDEVRRNCPELKYARPLWVHTAPGNWAQVIPLREDIQFLANLTRHADINLNHGSTMTLDFAIHDRPVVNVAFDVASPPCFGVPLWDFHYRFEHYRPVIELGAARFARSADELAHHVNAYLESPHLDREGRRKLVALEIGRPIGQSSQYILEALQQISAQATPLD